MLHNYFFTGERSRTMSLIGFVVVLSALFFNSTIATADDKPKPDSNLDILQYKTPANWQSSDQTGVNIARTLVAPDSTLSQQAVMLLIVTPAKADLNLAADFDAAVKQLTSEGKTIDPGEVVSTKTRQGFDAVSRTVITEKSDKQRVYARMIAAKVNNRMVGIYFLATSEELYKKHDPEMDALLQSVSFKVAADGVAAKNANAPVAKAEIESLEKQKQELLKKVAELDARQRQLQASIAGSAPAAMSSEQLVANAKERYVKEAAGRRKAHTITGNILGTDGKPIPNVEAYTVNVWGTTIAAEKTRYGIEVDANGHFEQQVPDGLYQIKATCIVTNDGHRVPVDLVCLDDKKIGVDEASTKGIVKDYCLAMQGLKPGENPKDLSSYFGGSITVNGPTFDLTRGHLNTRHPNSTVQLDFTPIAPLVDGTRGEPFTVKIDSPDLNYGQKRANIPIGTYRVTATLIEKDGTKLQLTCSPNNGNYYTSIDVFWECVKDRQESRANPMFYLKD